MKVTLRILALAFPLALAAACSGAPATSGPAPADGKPAAKASEAAKPAEKALSAKDAEALVKSAVAAMANVKTYHVAGSGSMSVKDPEKGTTEKMDFSFDGDVSVPDRYKMTMKMSGMGESQEVEMVQVGKTALMRTKGDPNWTTDSPSGLAGGFDPRSGLDDFKSLKDFKDLGMETVAGKRTRHIQGAFDMKSLMGGGSSSEPVPAGMEELAKALLGDTKGSMDAWIGDDGYLVRQKVSISMALFGVPMTMDFDMTYSNFDKPVTIELPR